MGKDILNRLWKKSSEGVRWK